MYDRVVVELTALGLSKSQIEAATEQYRFYLGIDLFYDARTVVQEATKGSSVAETALACFTGITPDELKADRSAAVLRKCLAEKNALGAEAAAALDDLEQFQREGTLRRREVFLARRQ